MWTIRETADGRWELVRADGEGDTLVLTVVDDPHDTYGEAVDALTTQLADVRAAQLDDGPTEGAVDGLLAEAWVDVDGIAFSEPTGDGRDFTDCVWSWRDPAVSLLPLMYHDQTDFGHFGARLAGFIETISLEDNRPRARGRFYDNEIGRAARDVLLAGRRFGVSVDPGAVDVEWVVSETDDDGWPIEEEMIFHAYQIIGLTMTPFPGFERAAIMLEGAAEPVPAGTPAAAPAAAAPSNVAAQLAMSEDDMVTDHEFEDSAETGFCSFAVESDGDTVQRICGVVEAMHGEVVDAADDAEAEASVRASGLAVRARPPRGWFYLPEPSLDLPDAEARALYGMAVSEMVIEQPDGGMAIPLTIRDDGLVFANLARWGQCHVGYPGQCVSPPESQTAYAHFNVGAVQCDDGSTVAAGTLTMGCEHAPLRGLSASEARDHYAHSGMGWANVRVVTGQFGPWACGVLRPDVTEDQVRILRSLSLSGDWRRSGTALELIGALAVNVPGFPIARESVLASGMELVASARVGGSTEGGVATALVAAGVVHRCAECAKRGGSNATTQAAQGVSGLSEEDRRLLRSMDSRLGVIERRTTHLRAPARDQLAERIRGRSQNGQ